MQPGDTQHLIKAQQQRGWVGASPAVLGSWARCSELGRNVGRKEGTTQPLCTVSSLGEGARRQELDIGRPRTSLPTWGWGGRRCGSPIQALEEQGGPVFLPAGQGKIKRSKRKEAGAPGSQSRVGTTGFLPHLRSPQESTPDKSQPQGNSVSVAIYFLDAFLFLKTRSRKVAPSNFRRQK